MSSTTGLPKPVDLDGRIAHGCAGTGRSRTKRRDRMAVVGGEHSDQLDLGAWTGCSPAPSPTTPRSDASSSSNRGASRPEAFEELERLVLRSCHLLDEAGAWTEYRQY